MVAGIWSMLAASNGGDAEVRRVRACVRSGRSPLVVGGALLALLLISPARSDEAPVATIRVSSATSGSSFGRLVEGVMSFRGNDYLLRLRGVTEPVTTVGSVHGLLRPRDIEGVFEPTDQGLRNAAGVTVRFDPPLSLGAGRLEIEVSSRMHPKISGGHRESGVE
jgi:hypothetical protein